jgi:hypothetical protein
MQPNKKPSGDGALKNLKDNNSYFTNENPATGLNANIEFMGKQLHVQTETVGSPAAYVMTQVFNNGRVIFSKKTECSNDLSEIQSLIHQQHAQVIRNMAEKEAAILNAS